MKPILHRAPWSQVFPIRKERFVLKENCLTGWHLVITFIHLEINLWKQVSMGWWRADWIWPNPASSFLSSGEMPLSLSWEAAAYCKCQVHVVCVSFLNSGLQALTTLPSGAPYMEVVIWGKWPVLAENAVIEKFPCAKYLSSQCTRFWRILKLETTG